MLKVALHWEKSCMGLHQGEGYRPFDTPKNLRRSATEAQLGLEFEVGPRVRTGVPGGGFGLEFELPNDMRRVQRELC